MTNRGSLSILAGAIIFFGAEATARADLTFYALSGNAQLGTLDVQTGAFTVLGSLPQIGTGDLARLPGGTLYGQESDQTFVTIDPTAVKLTTIGNTGNGILVITFRKDGTMFGASYTDLYTVDTTTAKATHVGTMGSFAAGFYDLTFDENDDLFLVQGTPSALYSVDSTTGKATMIGSTGVEVAAANYQNGTLYGFTTSSEIVSIDTKTGAATPLIMEAMAVSAVAVASPAVVADGGTMGTDAGTADGGGGTDAGAHDSGSTAPPGGEGGIADSGTTLEGDASGSSGSGQSSKSGCGCRVGAPAEQAVPASGFLIVACLVSRVRRRRRR